MWLSAKDFTDILKHAVQVEPEMHPVKSAFKQAVSAASEAVEDISCGKLRLHTKVLQGRSADIALVVQFQEKGAWENLAEIEEWSFSWLTREGDEVATVTIRENGTSREVTAGEVDSHFADMLGSPKSFLVQLIKKHRSTP